MGVCNVPVISTVCHIAGKAAGTVVSAPFDWIAQGVGGAAEWMFTGVWQLFDSTTLVDLTSNNYLKVYDILFGIAVFLMLLFFCLQLITGLIHRDPGALQRAGLGLAKSVVGSFLAVTLTGLALTITDELSVGIIQASGTTLDEMGGKIAALAAGIGAISVSAPGAGAVIIIFLGCLAITGAAIVWFSLLIRKSLLLVAVVFAPVALSGQSWDHARGWFSKWASFVVALIVSKLVVVVIFLVAINQLNAPLDLDLSSIANPVAGIVLMFVAAFAPAVAYKFISFIGFDLYHAMSTETEAKQAVNRPIAVPSMPGLSQARKVLGGSDDDNGGGGGAPPGGGGLPRPGGGAGGPGGSGGAAAGGAGGTGHGAGGSGGAASSEGGAGGAAGAGAAAGPAGLAAGAAVQAASAGPAAGGAVARAADQQLDAGQDSSGDSSSTNRDSQRHTPRRAATTSTPAAPDSPPAANASPPPAPSPDPSPTPNSSPPANPRPSPGSGSLPGGGTATPNRSEDGV